MATIVDVARAAGVSRATASRALGGYGVVSEATAGRVLAAAGTLGYQANGVARSMRTSRSNTVGAIVADIENAFFARVMRGFTDVARDHGFHVFLANTDEDPVVEQSALRVLQECRVDGVLVTPTSGAPAVHLHTAHAAGLPMVLLDRRVPGLAVDVVQIDNAGAARQATEHLVAAGHRQIAILTGANEIEVSAPASGLDIGVSTAKDRLDGYREALNAAGIEHRPEYVRTSDFHVAAAREEATRLLQLPDRPSAVFATHSTSALGVLLAVGELGLQVPDDVSVVGFDDADWTDVIEPGLSVVVQPVQEMGRLAATLLAARIRGEPDAPTRHLLETRWLARRSIGPPPRRHRSAAPV